MMASLTAQPGKPAAAQRVPAVPPATRRSGFAGTLRSEFTKIRSVRSTYFTLIAFFVAGLGFATAATEGKRVNAGHPLFDPTATSLRGAVYLGELIIVVIGALVITSEYGTRMVSTSMTAMPRRGVLYVAKAVVLAGVSLTVALITSRGGCLAVPHLTRLSRLSQCLMRITCSDRTESWRSSPGTRPSP
jgi:hypothetical protein